MKSKFWLTIASILAPFTAQANIDLHAKEQWVVKVRSQLYNVEILEVQGNTVRVKYDDGMVGMANKDDITWLTKLSSDFI
ncbi:hypothetical protein VPT02_011 [Vibrio phage VPT02]|nr:hypothetical protein VPT02_011 [Vibrio phage VPT02]QQO38367.1 hypothetical protein VPG01_009 [Vibrio phage VPG01]